MTCREYTEQTEQRILSPLACKAAESQGRDKPQSDCELRTVFQRDRDRIIHSKAFRRLKHKTQVFLAPEGDHYRTRLTHTLEVSQVARTIARALRLNEDLTEAVALGHDLGHTPFGHAGERILNELHLGGFAHYEQSCRVVEFLERDGQGLNLTKEVRNGILCHTKGPQADTLEGQAVRIADKIAYLNHDIDDAIRAGVLSKEDIPKEITDCLGQSLSQRVNTLVQSVVKNSKDTIRMDNATADCFHALRDFMFERVYKNPVAKGEEGKAQALLQRLYEYFIQSRALPEEYGLFIEKDGIDRAVCDYVASMSDVYALHVHEEVFIPKSWSLL